MPNKNDLDQTRDFFKISVFCNGVVKHLLLWVVRWHVLVVSYQCFRTAYWFHLLYKFVTVKIFNFGQYQIPLHLSD